MRSGVIDGHMFESKEYFALCVVGLDITTLYKTFGVWLQLVSGDNNDSSKFYFLTNMMRR